MIELAVEPFGDDELVRFSFSSEGNDAAWHDAVSKYATAKRKSRQFFLIDNRNSLGTATFGGIKEIFVALQKAGVRSLYVAQVSRNPSFEIIARLTEAIGVMEDFEVISELFETVEEAEGWLLKQKEIS
jgi:hypothetical protein